MKYEIQVAELDCWHAYIKDAKITFDDVKYIKVLDDGFEYDAIILDTIIDIDFEELAEYTSFKITKI